VFLLKAKTQQAPKLTLILGLLCFAPLRFPEGLACIRSPEGLRMLRRAKQPFRVRLHPQPGGTAHATSSLAPLKGSLAATVLEGLCMLRRAKQPFRVSDASCVFAVSLLGCLEVAEQARKLHPKGLLRSARRFWGKNRGCEHRGGVHRVPPLSSPTGRAKTQHASKLTLNGCASMLGFCPKQKHKMRSET
jgi:hypothetical protein